MKIFQKILYTILACIGLQSCYFHQSYKLIKTYQLNSLQECEIRFIKPKSLYIDIPINKDDSAFKNIFLKFDTLLSKMKDVPFSKERINIYKEYSRNFNLRIFITRDKDWIMISPYLQVVSFQKPGSTIALGRIYDIAEYSRDSYYNDKALTNEFIRLSNQVIAIKDSSSGKKDSASKFLLPLVE